MKSILIFFLLIAFTYTTDSIGAPKHNYIDYIGLKFEHSRRIPNHIIHIELIKRQSEFVARVKSEPMDSSREFINTRIDKTISIDKTLFIEIAGEILKFREINLKKAFLSGKDGTECSIEFGKFGNTLTYKFWTADYKTKVRDLTHFLAVFRKILKIGGFNPDEIM